MKTTFTTFAMLMFLSFNSEDVLLGRWESKSETGNITGVIFKADNSFEAYVNRKSFATGTYTFKDDVFSFVDNGCNGIRGYYKIQFNNASDSMRFVAINDSCEERREGMQRMNLGRVKEQ